LNHHSGYKRSNSSYNGNNILNIWAKSNRKFNLVIIKIPAVTIVAACINAETGVGAIASGNQVYNGICADFPQAPMNKASGSRDPIHINL
jgi:hypothetical protein